MKSWRETKAMFEDVANSLGVEITKYSYVSPDGRIRYRPKEGDECFYVTVRPNGPTLVAAALREGFVPMYNGGLEIPAALCYTKRAPVTSKWGGTLKVWEFHCEGSEEGAIRLS